MTNVYEKELLEAVNNTPGAKITPQGIEIDIVRYQKSEQHGRRSLRQGVFYLPEKKSPYQKHYTTGKHGYGGGERIEGRTILKNVIIVKGATGGKAVERVYDYIKGRNAYKEMRSDVLKCITGWNKSKNETEDCIIDLFEKYKGDSDLVYDIVRYSTQGNTLAYAVQEHIVANAIRKAGYDGMVAYSKSGGKLRLSEVFDVRAFNYPIPGQADFLYEDFYK